MITIDVLRRAGIEVDVASVEDTLQIEASRGVKLVADKFISDCPPGYDVIALPVCMPQRCRCIYTAPLLSSSVGCLACCGRAGRRPNAPLLRTQGGMPGAKRLGGSAALLELLHEQRRSGRLYSAICAAPAVVFEPHGLLDEGEKKKAATCHPGFVSALGDRRYGH